MKKINLFLTVSLLITFNIGAQDIDKMETKFDYIQLPSKPLDKSIKNYNSRIINNVEEHNKKLMDDYNNDLKKVDEDYQREMAAYPAKVKEANETYLKEMELYDKKSALKKLAEKEMANQGKPIKNVPSTPYKRTPSQPKLKKVFNYDQLAGTYLKLEGFNPGVTNAISITAIPGDLEMKEPEIKVADKTNISNGKSTPYKEYTSTIAYKRLITLKVETPQSVIYDEVPQEITKELTYKSPEFKSESELNSWWNNNKVKITENLETQTMENDLKVIQNLLNDNYAFKRTSYQADLFLIKDKKVDYSDYQNAYMTAVEGYNKLADDFEKVQAKKNLIEAISIWEKALTESDMNNKKARVDEKVTYATYINLIEACIWCDDYAKAKSLAIKFSTFDAPNKFKKRCEELTAFNKVQSERYKGFYGN